MPHSNQGAKTDAHESEAIDDRSSPSNGRDRTGGVLRRTVSNAAGVPTTEPRVSRRAVMKTLGSGLVVGAGTGVASARGGADRLAHQLNVVRAGTRNYRDFTRAKDDGYEPVLGYVPGMGFHFVRGDLIAEDHTAGPVDGLENPPILVYFTTGNYDPDPGDAHDPDRNDDLRLGGVEFAHAGDDEAPGTPGNYFADEESSRNLKTTEAEGWEFVEPAGVTAIHVWVHRNNPKGVFHPTNPTIDR